MGPIQGGGKAEESTRINHLVVMCWRRERGKSSLQGSGRTAAQHGQLPPLLPLPLEGATSTIARAELGTAVQEERAVPDQPGLECGK